MPNPYFIFAGGGTGGHLYPGLAVAEALVRHAPEASVTFLTTERPLDAQLLRPTPHTQITQPVCPFTAHPARVLDFVRRFKRSVALAREQFAQRKPAAVLGLGGYAAGPPVAAARRAGIPSAILNPDALPGRANRWLARRCDRVFTQWPIAHAHLPRQANCECVGCPIRSAFATADRAAGCARFELDPDRPVLLATGASQGARTLNQALVRAWPRFVTANPAWQLLHLTGPADEAETRSAYEAAGAPARVIAFTDEMPLALAAADLVLSRAGASTLAELTTLGLPSILLPYPYHRDQHQRANANALADVGAAEVVEDTTDAIRNAAALEETLGWCAEETTRSAMSEAAGALARPNAADAVAKWLLARA